MSVCETCTEPQFLQWICGVHAKATDCEQKLRVHQADVLKLPSAFDFVQLVIESTNKQFTTMTDGDRWSPATKSKAAEGPIPAGFQAAVDKRIDKKIKSAMADAGLHKKTSNGGANPSPAGGGRGNGSGRDKSKDTCNKCGKTGHWARKC